MRTHRRVLLALALLPLSMVFVACGSKESAPSRPKLNPLPASGILVFSGHPEAAEYLVEGWYPIQPDVAWTNGRAKARLSYSADQIKNFKTLSLSLQAAVASLPIDVVIHTAGHDYSFPVSTGHGQASIVAEVPLQADADGSQEIDITSSPTVVPAQYGLGPDQRTLGVGLTKIQLNGAASGR